MSCLLIVDGHAYAYRAFHAIRSLSSPGGQPTNAIFGFIKMLGRMRSSVKPTHLAVVWDGGLDPERMRELPEYKAQRPEMPEALESQLGEIQDYLAGARIPSMCRDGVEADDWIAALAMRAADSGMSVVIASSDKDFMQLVSPAVGLLNPADKTEAIRGVEEVRAKTGLEPGQIVDWLSLIGDTVDNIAGVPGVGPKTATELLRQFGSVDGIYSRLDEVKSERVRASLKAAEGAVRRNVRLIRLKTDLPCDTEPRAFAVREPDTGRLMELYGRWGFKSLAADLAGERQVNLL